MREKGLKAHKSYKSRLKSHGYAAVIVTFQWRLPHESRWVWFWFFVPRTRSLLLKHLRIPQKFLPVLWICSLPFAQQKFCVKFTANRAFIWDFYFVFGCVAIFFGQWPWSPFPPRIVCCEADWESIELHWTALLTCQEEWPRFMGFNSAAIVSCGCVSASYR